jgi:hypothetical protein
MKHLILTLSILLMASSAQAANTGHNHQSKYSGEETRTIKSLSAKDIEELKRGGGWGLAKAAELNGVPGPAHLLELKDKIPLDASQIKKITGLYQDMKKQASAKGERLIALEQKLDEHFRAGTIDAEILQSSLAEIGRTRSELRFIHLATHLETPNILSHHQIRKYNSLRGYSH